MTTSIAADWFVYMLECADGTFYTGITTDPVRRLAEHNGSARGARYTRSRRPVTLCYHEQAASRSAAGKREWQLRRLSRARKQALLHDAAKRGWTASAPLP